MVKHKPISDQIEDFCVVEFQTCSTTGTGKLVNAMQDFMNGDNIENKRYSYGMNTYNDIKLSFIQMLNKGQVFEIWNKKIIWAVQRFLYDNMVNRFRLKNMEFNKENANIFLVCDIDYFCADRFKIIVEDTYSSTIENLMKAFKCSELPKVDDFIKVLHNKLKLNLGIKI